MMKLLIMTMSLSPAAVAADFLGPPTSEDYANVFQLRKDVAIAQKNLAAFVPVARLYVRDALERADALEASDPERAHALLHFAKAMTYNVAADTWPGWDDGTEITAEMMQLGLEAANLNLEVAKRLKLDDERMSVAHWIIGAHQLARGELAAARREFEKSLALTQSPLLIEGYLALADYLESGSAEALDTLHARRDAIKARSENEWDWKQLDTAKRAFAKSE